MNLAHICDCLVTELAYLVQTKELGEHREEFYTIPSTSHVSETFDQLIGWVR